MKTRSKLEARSVTRRSRDAGFSLIEVLVVIASILIIAAIAMPRLLPSRMAANEAGAVAALPTIATVQVTYNFPYQQGFAPSLAALGPPPPGNQANASQAGLVDEVLASSIRNGYSFVYYWRSEEHTSELQSRSDIVCRLLLERQKRRLARTWLLNPV